MRTQDARNIPIVDYLDRIGAKFARTQQGTNGLEYVYHSPTRSDTKPSLCVNIERNIWSDVPVGAGGRLIELVCHIHNLPNNDVKSALEVLDSLYPTITSFSTKTARIMAKNQSQPLFDDSTLRSEPRANNATGLNKKSAAIEVLRVQPLFSYPLKQYLQNERKINLAIACKYVKEVTCRLLASDKQFYSVGFASGSTFAIRNKHFKGFAGLGVDISVFDKGTSKVLLFEGFIDFLSYLTAKNLDSPPFTAVVLNSSAMLGRFIHLVEQQPVITQVDYFRDRDELNNKSTGLETLAQLQTALSNKKINDLSSAYPNHKDLNEWLIYHVTNSQ
ncbi:toprim domain-containing protein [Pseudoalteromonas rubra]|uniref:toprim domain-containing protein n=1 Tax=Pseudoalteromonas rubra TaxID=43658 RepID=UPI000F785D64|nr:toprim domain-containing protein [Pseudoalteromonas rubra]